MRRVLFYTKRAGRARERDRKRGGKEQEGKEQEGAASGAPTILSPKVRAIGGYVSVRRVRFCETCAIRRGVGYNQHNPLARTGKRQDDDQHDD